MSDTENWLNSAEVRTRYRISAATLNRWDRDEALEFPAPMVINRRKLYPPFEAADLGTVTGVGGPSASCSMSAIVLPFRFARRLPQIRKTAGYMVSVPANHAEGHLREQLRRLEDGLRKKGVAEPLIRSEVGSYEGAIRAHLWRLLISQGGAA